jgi:hypothetical protein
MAGVRRIASLHIRLGFHYVLLSSLVLTPAITLTVLPFDVGQLGRRAQVFRETRFYIRLGFHGLAPFEFALHG